MGVISAHYPERAGKLFIVNAPFWFSTIWRVVSPLVDPNTRAKISILGSNYAVCGVACELARGGFDHLGTSNTCVPPVCPLDVPPSPPTPPPSFVCAPW